MRLFVDTNIFLDLILKREHYRSALELLTACYNRTYHGVVADITLLNIDYIASKQDVDIHAFIATVVDGFEVVGADNEICREALHLDNADFEDSVQYILAKTHTCDLIVSNDKTFYRGEIGVLTAQEALSQIM